MCRRSGGAAIVHTSGHRRPQSPALLCSGAISVAAAAARPGDGLQAIGAGERGASIRLGPRGRQLAKTNSPRAAPARPRARPRRRRPLGRPAASSRAPGRPLIGCPERFARNPLAGGRRAHRVRGPIGAAYRGRPAGPHLAPQPLQWPKLDRRRPSGSRRPAEERGAGANKQASKQASEPASQPTAHVPAAKAATYK